VSPKNIFGSFFPSFSESFAEPQRRALAL